MIAGRFKEALERVYAVAESSEMRDCSVEGLRQRSEWKYKAGPVRSKSILTGRFRLNACQPKKFKVRSSLGDITLSIMNVESNEYYCN